MMWLAAAGAAAVLSTWGATETFGHADDQKLLDAQPRYEGPGWRRGDRGAGPDFPSSGVQLESWITLPEMHPNANAGNDCWGYVSPTSGREYAIMGMSNGTSFVEVTDPANPSIIGFIDGPNSTWRDIKTYQHYAYAVSEGGNGIQVINLANIDSGEVTLVREVLTGGTEATHNVAIDTESGYLYRCGGGSNGIRIYSLANPDSPLYIGGWFDRYCHDAQAITVPTDSGPRELVICCGGLNGGSTQTGVDILDVTEKQNIIRVGGSYFSYTNSAYSHQAWVSSDGRYLYLNDELNESALGLTSTLHVIDLQDPANPDPVELGAVTNGSSAITHNLYTRDQYIFCANYRSGLRIYDATDPVQPVEVGFFDTYPDNDGTSFNGLWSNYPYFPSGTVIGSDIERGLFVWSLTLNELQVALVDKPALVAPQGQIIEALVTELDGELDPSSVTLHYDAGAGFAALPMSPVEGDVFSAALPELTCGSVLRYYVRAETTEGVVVSEPRSAPNDTFEALVAYDAAVAMYDDMESGLGWMTSAQGATSGHWERGVPINDPTWAYGPAGDADGSGAAWVTDNGAGNTDIDNGLVRLVSPAYDLTGGGFIIEYDYFLRLTEPGSDYLLVELSVTGPSGPWHTLALHETDGGRDWRHHVVELDTLENLDVPLSDAVRLRFTANDASPQSINESGVDALKISQVDCEPPGIVGDLNGSGSVDVFDLLDLLGQWGACGEPCPPCDADLTDDCNVDVFDLLTLLGNWG